MTNECDTQCVAPETSVVTDDPMRSTSISLEPTDDPCIPYVGANVGTTKWGFIPCTVETTTTVGVVRPLPRMGAEPHGAPLVRVRLAPGIILVLRARRRSAGNG